MLEIPNEIEPILEVRDLTKHFTSGNIFTRHVVRAVEGASFKLHRGKVVALVGESGSGKSTIVRMLARLYQPTRGEILFEGKNSLEGNDRLPLKMYRSRVQMIFQDPFSSLNPVHKVGYHIERPLRLYGMFLGYHGKAAIEQQVGELLKRVSLTPVEEFRNKYPHQLSGGQRQRVAIARALAVEPDVILADEPVSMLDVSIRMGVLNLMAELRDKQGIAFLYVTHDIASARYFADETLVMYAGRIVEGAPSEDLIQSPKHPYTQLLLASVPDPSRGLRTGVSVDKGEVPDLASVGVGCPFAARCPHVMDVCRKAMPPVTTLPDKRWVRCYLYENGVPQTQMKANGVAARQAV
ncbi:MAG: ABC transporter ATP-binding protein [Burkholderiales bacterium]|nr:ABC transporter ATP-binding protein [Anaerolineae bacterium]